MGIASSRTPLQFQFRGNFEGLGVQPLLALLGSGMPGRTQMEGNPIFYDHHDRGVRVFSAPSYPDACHFQATGRRPMAWSDSSIGPAHRSNPSL